MRQQLSLIRYKLAKAFHQHEAFVVIVAVLLVLTGLVLRINALSNVPMDEAYYNEQTSKLKTVNFNQAAIKEIEALRDSNVTDPGTELPSDRTNPFVE